MREIGQLLRETRERQGISLERVYETTRINPRYVAALEAGEFEVIPGEVYLKGFLREYARAVGLDGEELVRRYRELRASLAPPPEPAQGVRVAWQEPRRMKPVERRTAGSTGRRLLAFAAVGLAALATGWALAVWSVNPLPETPPPSEPSRHAAPPASPAPTVPPAAVPAPEAKPAPAPAPAPRAAEPAAPVSPAPTPDRPAPAPAAPAAPSAGPTTHTPPPAGGTVKARQPVTVTARLTERCWVKVEADGRVIYQGEAASGTQFTWGAAERLTVRLGNPTAVRLAWNGRALDLPAQGPVTRTFTREGMAAPAPSAAPASPAASAPAAASTGTPAPAPAHPGAASAPSAAPAAAPSTVAPVPASPSPAAEPASASGAASPGTVTIVPTSAP